MPSEFQNRVQLFSKAVNGKIDKIYRLIQGKKTVYFEPIEGSYITIPRTKFLIFELNELHEALIVYYTEERRDISSYASGNRASTL